MSVKCEKCEGEIVDVADVFRHNDRELCEDCYIDSISPPKACDPWAVYIAKTAIATDSGLQPVLSDKQRAILAALGESGGMEPESLAARVELKLSELERELATLRHMEKIKGTIRDGIKIILLW